MAGDRGGRPNWCYCRRPVEASMHKALNMLGIHNASTPSLGAYNAIAEQVKDPPPRVPEFDWVRFRPDPADQARRRVLGLHVTCFAHKKVFLAFMPCVLMSPLVHSHQFVLLQEKIAVALEFEELPPAVPDHQPAPANDDAGDLPEDADEHAGFG